MASKLALRALGAVALPGAFLAVVAPTASAVELVPGAEHISGSGTVERVERQAPATPEASDVTGLTSSRHLEL